MGHPSRVLGIVALAMLAVVTAATTQLIGVLAAPLVLLAVAASETMADAPARALTI